MYTLSTDQPLELILKALDKPASCIYSIRMGKYQVIQIRNQGPAVVRHDGIRRFNGALTVQEELLQNTVDWMRSKALPGERIVQGPTGVENEVAAVLLMNDGTDFVLATRIVKK